MPVQFYRLPDGRVVAVDATAAKNAPTITFTLESGQIVDAIRHPSDRDDCHECGHRLSLHRRYANGAFRCAYFGCGCEQAKV